MISSTFCEAVRSSARALARFFAHWLSCIAEAWSLMVGTAALEAVTILAPGWSRKERDKLCTGFHLKPFIRKQKWNLKC